MPYDGSTWDESNPTNSTLANEIDDVARDMKIGIRGRMANEHIWSSSQTGTSEAGYHTWISFQAQTAAVTLPIVASVTQGGLLFMSSAAGLQFVTSGSTINIIGASKSLNIIGAAYSSTGTLGELIIGTTGGTLRILAPGSSGSILTATTGGAGVMWGHSYNLGTWNSVSLNQSIQATADGFFVGTITCGQTDLYYSVFSDGSNPPTTLRHACAQNNFNVATGADAFTIPVRSGDYFKVVTTGTTSGVVFFLPIGA